MQNDPGKHWKSGNRRRAEAVCAVWSCLFTPSIGAHREKFVSWAKACLLCADGVLAAAVESAQLHTTMMHMSRTRPRLATIMRDHARQRLSTAAAEPVNRPSWPVALAKFQNAEIVGAIASTASAVSAAWRTPTMSAASLSVSGAGSDVKEFRVSSAPSVWVQWVAVMCAAVAVTVLLVEVREFGSWCRAVHGARLLSRECLCWGCWSMIRGTGWSGALLHVSVGVVVCVAICHHVRVVHADASNTSGGRYSGQLLLEPASPLASPLLHYLGVH